MILERKTGLWVPTDVGLRKAFRWVQISSVLDMALSYVPRRRMALDIGAHIGIYARKLAAVFENVAAFEPSRAAYDCLLKNTEGLANVTSFNLACGEASRTCGLTVNKHGMGKIEPMGDVHMTKIDAWDFAPDFVKIDTDGYEIFVLDGMREMLAKDKPVVMIEDFHNFGKKADPINRYTPRLVAAEMAKLGYRLAAEQAQDKVYTCSS